MTPTAFICTAVCIVAVLYDLIVITYFGNINLSISRWFASYAGYPGIVFGVGYLCGHFFGLMTPTPPAAGPLTPTQKVVRMMRAEAGEHR